MKQTGDKERNIITQAQAMNMPMPPEIAEAPQVSLGLALYYEAFWDLNSTRPIGLSFGMIPWTAIVEYARFYEFDREQAEDLLYYVREMDNAWLEFHKPKDTGKVGKNKWRPAKTSGSLQKG